jgi:hypothetical protein
MSIHNNRNRVLGSFRYFFGFCPKCNSDAPELYSCPVCQYNEMPKYLWWEAFLLWRKKGHVPTFQEIKRMTKT